MHIENGPEAAASDWLRADNTFGIPEEDLCALRGLDPSGVQRVALVRAKVHEGQMQALLSIHNAAAPINHRLPPELLIHIFSLFNPIRLGDVQLMHVCRYWRSILSKTPQFWTEMLLCPEIWDHTNLLRMALRLSGSLPLTVRPAPESLLSELMIPHLHRVSDLRLAIQDTMFSKLCGLLRDGLFFNLVSLRLVALDRAGPEFPQVLETQAAPCTDANLPSLRRLELSARFIGHGLVVSSVQSLSVLSDTSPWTSVERIPGDVLFQTLHRCSSTLKSLHLGSTLPTVGWDRLPPMLGLPSLHTLTLTAYDHAEPVRSFLSSIVLPSTASLTINSEGRCTALTFRDLLPESFIVSVADEFSFAATYAYQAIAFHQDGRLLLKLDLPGGETAREQLAEVITRVCGGAQTINTVTLSCMDDAQISRPELLSLLNVFHRLARLVVRNLGLALSTWFPYRLLGHQPASEVSPAAKAAYRTPMRGNALPLCPMLEEFVTTLPIVTTIYRNEVFGWNDLRPICDIVSMLQARRSAFGHPLKSFTICLDLTVAHFSPECGDGADEFLPSAQDELKTLLASLVDNVMVVIR
ncbi:hypothetical protein OH77DRAFT_1588350 [Trametes cingulata]|nr:hypothetical protein OH77DRAFT_1588350 [Trametes cingulata]